MKFLDGIRAKAASWQLPVRIPVPNRDNLIAMGLMALAFGLMVGVAIGPALGTASNAAAGIVSPFTAATPEEPATDIPSEDTTASVALSPPAGGDTVTTAMNTGPDPSADTGIDTSTDTTTDLPDTSVPVDDTPDNQLESDKGGNQDENPVVDSDLIELKGTVAGVAAGGRVYFIADSSGNMIAVHAESAPAIGAGVVVQAFGLANGTFAEEEAPVRKGIKTKSKLRGVVSWLDPVSGVAVLSSLGASLAVDLTGIIPEEMPGLAVGSSVDAEVLVSEPDVAADGVTVVTGLTMLSAEVFGDPLDQLELNGKVESVDPEKRTMKVAADSSGLVPATIEITLPKAFDTELALPGKIYSLSAKVTATGSLLLTGLSADYSRKAADDPELAFGTQA